MVWIGVPSPPLRLMNIPLPRQLTSEVGAPSWTCGTTPAGDAGRAAVSCDARLCSERLIERKRSSWTNISVGVIGLVLFHLGLNTLCSSAGVVVIAVVAIAWSRWA